MWRWILYLNCFFITLAGYGQDCPNLLDPLPNAMDVPIDTSIGWEEVVGIAGYIISVGTTFGGGEIVNEQPVGSDTTFAPPLGLPESSLIYVTITLFFFDQSNIVCASQSFTTEDVLVAPGCTLLNSPLDGTIDVNVGTNLSWNYAAGATGYRITIGTAPGTGDFINNLDVGNALSFNSPMDFPPGTTIYVGVVPYNENGSASACPEESFITGELGPPPRCTQLITPMDGATNVELSPLIEWEAVPDATGYKVDLGKSPFINDVLDEAIFFTNSTFVLNFEPNTTYFIRIVPFNDAGDAQDCGQQSFSTILGCGPFIDITTGELVFLGPIINFPDQVGICENHFLTRVTSPDQADGYRWYKIVPTGEEVLISEERFVDLSEIGQYRYEAYKILNQDGIIIECADGKEFTVVSSSIATIEDIIIEEVARLFYVTVIVSGSGDYEYSLDRNGPYSDNNTLLRLTEGSYTFYVRDKNGCGIVSRSFAVGFPLPGFPRYFSPNEDGINDYWQYRKPIINALPLTTIFIYDRYGRLLANFSPKSRGWDGQYENSDMPSSSYWYKAFTADNRVFTGYFSLIRRRR